MFRLESYITPILLDYVAKYVKNLREENAQVSLWEGEATFYNLDLRLDVLEEELNLPVELVSGHIHELTIQVPWHKLTSEPTRIIINTIEFVAKLRGEKTPGQSSPTRQRVSNEANQSSTENQQQQSTISSLVSKIINNIAVTCHNIILKYVEDDIVVSMNVQLLNFGSASEDWIPAMIDVHPIYVVLRKLLQVSDLTICLDKRNAAGRIDVCQEPLLYRCTLECRLLHKHNVNSANTTSTIRVGVFTKAMDINVSSLQFPMVMRLVKLLLALKSGDINVDMNVNTSENTEEKTDLNRKSRTDKSQQKSYFSWAWNLLPSFENISPDADEEEIPGHVVDIGVYAEELNFQLKNSEYIVDQMMGGMRRIRYTPIMRISLGGIYYERSAVKERDWANVKAGLSSICVEPLGSYRTEEHRGRTLVDTAPCQGRAFIDKSLFDNHYAFAEKSWSTTNYEDYTSRITDEYMLYRSPVLAFDVVEYKPMGSSSNTDTHESVQKDFGGLRVQYRLLSAGITFHYSQSFLQVKNVISDFIESYDYLEYSSYDVEKLNTGTRPTRTGSETNIDDSALLDDYDDIFYDRQCSWRFELRNMVIEFHARQLPDNSMNINIVPNSIKHSLPYLDLHFTLIEGNVCCPQNGKKIVKKAIQMADKPRELLDACYDIYKFNVKNVSLNILNTTNEQHKSKLLFIPKMQLQYKRLLLQQLWKTNEAALDSIEANCELATLDFSKREMIMTIRLLALLFSYDYIELHHLANMVMQSNLSYDVIKLQTYISKLRINTRRYHHHLNFIGSVRGLNVDVYHSVMQMRNLVLTTTKGTHNKWLELQVQLPYNVSQEVLYSDDKSVIAAVIGVWLESYRFTVDTFLMDFLAYKEKRKITTIPDAASETELNVPMFQTNQSGATFTSWEGTVRKTSRNTRKISQPEETVHASSDREEKRQNSIDHSRIKLVNESPVLKSTKHIDFFKSLVLIVDIAGSKIQIAETMTTMFQSEKSQEYILIILPRLNVKSMYCDLVVRSNIRTKITVPANANSFNWTVELFDMGLKYRNGENSEWIVETTRTTAIIAISHKYMKYKRPKDKKTITRKSFEKHNAPLFSDMESQKPEDEYNLLSEHSAPKKVDKIKEKEDSEFKSIKKSVLSVNLHIDTSEVRVFGRRLKALHQHFLIFKRTLDLLRSTECKVESPNLSSPNRIEILTATEECLFAKEFLDLDSISLDESLSINEVEINYIVLGVFCQWIIPRIKLEIESNQNHKSRKLVFQLEDLLLNVDKHSDFIKYTSKIENISLNYYESIISNQWIPRNGVRIRMLSDNTNQPLLNVIVTTVSLRDLHSRIGIKCQSDVDNTLSELVISLLPIEIILDLEQIMDFTIPLCEIFDIMHESKNTKQKACCEEPKQSVVLVCDLPMVHLNIKGITIYFPVNTGKPNCTVLCCKVIDILMTPNLENPLQRNPIRLDLYNKAAELGMLSTPGAVIEDRQYELSMKAISMHSGNWNQVLAYLLLKDTTAHENPAVEWNNQSHKLELKLTHIFSDFTFLAIFAPAISFCNVLVCGQAIEFNCVTDFVANLNTHQINLISCILYRLYRFSSISERACTSTNLYGTITQNLKSVETIPSVSLPIGIHSSSSQSDRFSQHSVQSGHKHMTVKTLKETHITDSQESKSTVLESAKSDSGMQSCSTHLPFHNNSLLQIEKAKTVVVKKNIPESISFIAGIFIVKVFSLEVVDEEAMLKPVILCTISQPNFLYIQDIYDSKQHASVFNITFNIPYDKVLKVQQPPTELENNLFTEVLLDTNPGNLNSSGIPPPLISYKSLTDRHQYVEVDIELLKPIILNCREECMLQLTTDLLYLYTELLESPCFAKRTVRPIVRCSKLRQFQLQCMKANRFRITCDRILLKFFKDSKYKCKVVCSDFMFNVKFRNRPEKAIIKASVGAFYINVDHNVLLHPVLLRLATDLVSEPWCEQPLVNTSLKINYLHVDVAILMLVKLRNAHNGLKKILDHMEKQWHEFLLRRPLFGVAASISKDSLMRIKTPNLEKDYKSKLNRNGASKEEFYQDDLRAGAFQFVDLTTDTVLPMPYQIQIIKKNYGIICWRYPQPRRMNKINIYPVPMPVDNPIQIRCRMEYFSESHEAFIPFCEFLLSESSTKEVKLPERDICANIWRVIILQSLILVNGECFEGHEEDEELQSIASMKIDNDFKNESDNDFILHPKVLVGCMRVDSAFQTKFVPKFRFLLSCNVIVVNFLNQPDAFVQLPLVLKNHTIKRPTLISQTFLTFDLDRLNIYVNFFNSNSYSVVADTCARIKCLDYGFLNMLDVVEPMKCQSYVRVWGADQTVKLNFLVEKLRLNIGPSIIHSLLSSKIHWEEVLTSVDELHTFIPKCIVVNRTQSDLMFGQSGTSECNILKPLECQLYYFRSDYHNQELTFSITDSISGVTDTTNSVHIPIRIDSDYLLHHLQIGNKCIIVKIGKLSTTQIYILVKGQIEVISHVPYDLFMEFQKETDNNDGKYSVEYTINANGLACFLQSVEQNSEILMRLKLGPGKGKGRTGDIPLKQNNNLPWLVKIPILTSQQFISAWIRVLREDLPLECNAKFQPQRILIIIWPIFSICNMLNSDVSCTENSSKTMIIVAAEGGNYPLSTATTHLTEHTLSFEYISKLGPKSKTDYTLTLKSMDWSKFFWYDEAVWTISRSLNIFRDEIQPNWPLDDEEELRVQRAYSQEGAFDVSYKCEATREFSCTLSLEIFAWGIFINATSLDISIYKTSTKDRTLVKSNSLTMLTILDSVFTIDIPFGTNWISSTPVYLNNAEHKQGMRYHVLQTNSNVDVVIIRNEEILKFLLELKVENERKIFKLRSKFVIANFSKLQLHVLPLAVDHKERASQDDVYRMCNETRKRDLTLADLGKSCIGDTIDIFYDINARKVKRNCDTAFVYFVCFLICKNDDISIPIPLSTSFTRRCFSIQVNKSSIALAVTLIKTNGVFYLNVYKDPVPTMILSNHTNLKFLVATTSASENSNVSNTTAEYTGKHFEWHHRLWPQSKCYYTPPQMYMNFPDIEFTVCNLSLALHNEDPKVKRKIFWSKPIRTDKTWKKFLRVPNHGDVKVIVCDKHRVIRISIYYVSQQMEFLVKDLRSRLLHPHDSKDSVYVKEFEETPLVSQTDLKKDESWVALDSNNSECIHFSNECETKSQITMCFFVKKIVISLHADNQDRDYIKTEVCNVYVDDLLCVFGSDDERHLNIQIPNLQIDNQLFSTGKYDFPVVICTEQLYKRTSCLPQVYSLCELYQSQSQQSPIMLITLNFYQDEFSLNSIHCIMSPFRAYIEDGYINQLLEALLDCEPSNCVYTRTKKIKRIILNKGQTLLPESIVEQARLYAEPLQLRCFVIEPLTLLLSVHTSLRLYIALDHSPLSFSRYERRQILTVPLRFGQSLGMHYLSGAIFGAGWVVGSLEILGSPSGLARSFTIGLRDFISMPVQGLLRGPWGFLVGITQGSASLLRNITAGTVNSVTKLASSVARNLDRLSLDHEHIERTEALRRMRPQGFTEGLAQGMTGLGISILGAVGGLAHHTLEARNSVDVLTGLTKGIVGAFTKPISGAAEMLALAGQGMLHTVGFNAMPHQVEPSVCRNMAIHPSCYKVWTMLPLTLNSDQILFFYKIKLVAQEHLQPAFIFLTSTVLAILDTENDKLRFVISVDRVEVVMDRDDCTKYYLHHYGNSSNSDLEEPTNFTNQRIMKFLNNSQSDFLATESFHNFLQPKRSHNLQKTDPIWVYYIDEHMGDHLMQYLRTINKLN